MSRGFFTSADVAATTADGESLSAIWEEFQATIELANSQRTALAELFTHTTTRASDMVAQVGATEDFEEASEFGVPTAINHTHELERMAYPLKWYDRATRFTSAFLRDATSEQVRTVHAQALDADNRLIFKQVFGAVLKKENRTNEDGQTVYALWNGDGKVPPAYAGETFTDTHTHYMTTASTQFDGVDLRDLIKNITEHGYGTASGDRIIGFVNPQEGESVRSFRVSEGDPFDFIPSESAPAYLTSEILVGERPPANYNGLTVIGGYGPAWIVEDHYVPKGYVMALATGGANAETNPVAMREHPRPEYKGLRHIPGDNQAYPLVNSYYSRGVGTGIRHRGAAAVMQVTESATYTSPSL